MVVACLIKELQVSCELRRMGEIGLLPRETVTNLISTKFETDTEEGEENDSLVRGEFDVIKELMENEHQKGLGVNSNSTKAEMEQKCREKGHDGDE